VSKPVEEAVSAAPAIAGEMNGARRIVPVATSWVARRRSNRRGGILLRNGNAVAAIA
jgi:hypothetical protein